MKTYIAFLRGINVGGNTILPMSELKSLCTGIGLINVRTYIQSGNVIFESELSEKVLTHNLEQVLQTSKQKHIPVVIRTVKELESVISGNPFSNAKPDKVGVRRNVFRKFGAKGFFKRHSYFRTGGIKSFRARDLHLLS